MSEIELLKESVRQLTIRVEELELHNDCGMLSAFVCGLPKSSRQSLFEAIEKGVADYFNIPTKRFFDSLVVGNRTGRRGRSLPTQPDNIIDEEDRVAVARFVLYAVLHVDFCVSVAELAEWYNVKVKNYIREWKVRYIRIFHDNLATDARYDDVYRQYWLGAHRSIIEECNRVGLFEELTAALSRLDNDGKIDNLYLLKWRIDTGKE